MELEDLRLAVYGDFRRTGRAPGVAALAERFGVADGEVRSGLAELADARHVVLGRDGEIVMAHPFSHVPLGFAVMGVTTLWWGGCCWDSFALPHLLRDEPDVLVATRCPGCDAAGAWVVDRHRPPDGDWLAHLLVPVAHMWDDVVYTCANQRLFCSEGCIREWLDRHGRTEGAVVDMPTLWRLASHWYEGRLDRGYVRRDPSAAGEYLRDVGLVGPFWGA